MEKFTHKCIRADCDNVYTTEEPEAYYCREHVDEKMRIARQVDAKMKSHRSERTQDSQWQKYESAKKFNGFPKASDFV